MCCTTRGISAAVVQALVAAVPAALFISDHNQYLPLHYACENGADPAVVACLLHANPAAATLLTLEKDQSSSVAPS